MTMTQPDNQIQTLRWWNTIQEVASEFAGKLSEQMEMNLATNHFGEIIHE
jgi:hypothetical protein